MGNLFLIIFLLLLGMALRHLPIFPKETPQVLNQYVIHISLPALVLLKIPHLQFTIDLIVPVIIPWIMLFFSVALIQYLAQYWCWSREITGCLMLTVPLGNTSFLGIPMIDAMFGPHAIPYGVLYDQMGSFPALSIYGAVVVSLYQANTSQRPTLSAIGYRIFTFPAFIALITALVVGPLFQDPSIQATLQRLAESGPPRGAGPSGAQPPLIPPDFLFDGSGIGHRGGYRFRVGLDEDERITGCWAWPNLDGYSGENTYWTNFRERTVQRAHLRASWKNQPPGTAPAASDLEGTALATY